MRKRYLIEISKDDQAVVACPSHLIEGRSLKRIAFGSKSLEVEFVPLPEKKMRIILSGKISEALSFSRFQLSLTCIF